MGITGWARQLWIYIAMTAVSITNFFLFGLSHYRTWEDASQYNTYASNLVLGNGYSIDGTTFNAFREPGFPFFLSFIYKIFGNENLLAACFIQALLLGVLGFLIYKVFERYGFSRYGIGAGFFISALPFYGFYANEILSEFLFAFFVGIVFFLCARIFHARGEAQWFWFALLGAASGYTALIRFQFVFFLPFIVICFLLFVRPLPKNLLRNSIIAFLLFASMLLPWAFYVQTKTGKFAVTEGRQGGMIYIRAVRAELSYSELTRYVYEWVRRSVTGGEGTVFLYTYEFKNLYNQYGARAVDATSTKEVLNENIRTIVSNPGHFLYGSLIEVIKLSYIEHDYTNSMNRYFRAGVYALMYAFFLFGLWQLIRRRGQLRELGVLALLTLGYNFLVLTLLDTIPRYNTPYLFCYIVVGFVGLALYMDSPKQKKKK